MGALVAEFFDDEPHAVERIGHTVGHPPDSTFTGGAARRIPPQRLMRRPDDADARVGRHREEHDTATGGAARLAGEVEVEPGRHHALRDPPEQLPVRLGIEPGRQQRNLPATTASAAAHRPSRSDSSD